MDEQIIVDAPVTDNEVAVSEDIIKEDPNVNETSNNEDLYAPLGDTEFKKEDTEDQNSLADEINNSEDLFGGEKSNDTSLTDNDSSIQNVSEQRREFEKLMGGIDAAEKYIKPSKSFDEQNQFDIKLLTTYMGKKYPIFIKRKFSLYSLIFGYAYLIYRKSTGIGIFYGLLLSFAVGITSSNLKISLIVLGLGLLINLFIAVVFNKKYIDKSYSRVKSFEVNNNGLADEVIIEKVASMGKLNIVGTILIVLIITAIGLGGGYYLSESLNLDLKF